MKPSARDISDLQVLTAVSKMWNEGERVRGVRAHRILMEERNYPYKVCYQALKRVFEKGYIQFGTHLESCWLTEKGKELLNAPPKPKGVSMRWYFKLHCRLNDIEYNNRESGVPKWFKEMVKEHMNYQFIVNRYYIDLSGNIKKQLKIQRDDEVKSMNVRKKIDLLKTDNGITLGNDEIEYYLENIVPFPSIKTRISLIAIYFNNYITSEDISVLSQREYIEFLLIMKKMLIGKQRLWILPHLMCSNCPSPVSEDTSELTTQSIIDYFTMNTFKWVKYEEKNVLGKIAEFDKQTVEFEVIGFLSSIVENNKTN